MPTGRQVTKLKELAKEVKESGKALKTVKLDRNKAMEFVGFTNTLNYLIGYIEALDEEKGGEE